MNIFNITKRKKITPLNLNVGDSIGVSCDGKLLIQEDVKKAMTIDEVALIKGKTGKRNFLGGIIIEKAKV